MLTEDTQLQFLPGVGARRADIFARQLKIYTVGGLLNCFPFKYIDRSRFYKISECYDDASYVQLRGRIIGFDVKGSGSKERLIATFTDGENRMELVWFKQLKYIRESLRINTDYIVFGRPTRFGNQVNIVHPDIDLLNEANIARNSGLQPFYNTTDAMKRGSLGSEQIRQIVYRVVSDAGLTVRETLPEEIILRHNLMPRREAFIEIHHPTDNERLARAQFRFKYEELFFIQIVLLRSSTLRQQKYLGFRFPQIGHYFNDFYHNHLPFALTGAQQRVIKEIRRDMNTGRQMNRLLQGDVGSGKTMVAMLTALIAIDNGFQVSIMAPTEILANQHYESISAQLAPLGVNVQLLTGSVKGKRREQILFGLKEGLVNILIGTHALIEDNVVFQRLGYAVIDEQHRFGVAQRAKLWSKGQVPPHILVMTATPIPRTLAMTVYGDLDVSTIDELPPGRKPVMTRHYYDSSRPQINAFLHNQLAAGRQIYVVYPLVKENEKMDLRAVECGFSSMIELFPECKVVMVHGRMRARDKDIAMQEFVQGAARIMVATTVIEVGVNVPNASVMVIENAERFGLSQLHQLRGRVGRGADQSYCILMSKYELSRDTRQRLDIMCRTNNGFIIAEEDMRLRGPGDMEGLQQSGLPFDLHIASLVTDSTILTMARDDARAVVNADPDLVSVQYRMVGENVSRLKRNEANWGAIS